MHDTAQRDGWLDELRTTGLVRADGTVRLTDDGRVAVDRLAAARCRGLERLLDGWRPDLHPQLAERLTALAHDLLGDGPGPAVGEPGGAHQAR